MPLSRLMTKSRVMENFFHILITLQVFIKAWDKAEHFHRYPLRVLFLFLAGVLMSAGVIFHHGLEKRIKNFKGAFHIFEGLILIVVATILWEEGKWRIPAFFFFIGGGYLVIGMIQLLSKDLDRDTIRFRLHSVLGVLFLVAAAATVTWNILKAHSAWLVVIAVICILSAAMNLRMRYVLIRQKRGKAESTLP